MSSTPASSFDDPLLVEFLAALENATERGGILVRYCANFPARADEFRALADMTRLLGHAETNHEPPMPAQLGEFRLVRLVGRGGMGEIYEAYHERLQRRVAVKIIRQGRISPDAHERFLREQHTLARLHQTHIVPIHAAGEEGPLQYFAMPFIEGAALHHAVRLARQLEPTPSGRRLPTLAQLASMVAQSARSKQVSAPAPVGTLSSGPPDESAGVAETASANDEGQPGRLRLSPAYFRSVAQLLADAADAVQHAHGAGILHRDIKPSNIMVDVHGECWIIDFGLAAWLTHESDAAGNNSAPPPLPEPVTRSGVLGTPQYMAPEQCRGKADERTDVWGLGVTLYELLTLRQAFGGRSDSAIHVRIQTEEPPSPTHWIANVPADLVAVCRKALRKEPGERYPTAAACADDLRRWLRLEPTVARPARTLRRVWLWGRRNPGWAAAILLAITLLGGGILYLKQALAVAETARDFARQEQATSAEAAIEQKRENLLQQLQFVLHSPHEVGWSREAWDLGKEAARIQKTDDLRNRLVATLAGLDMQPVIALDHVPTSAVAFDHAGRQLLLGGTNDPLGKPKVDARLYDRLTGTLRGSGLPGQGPVVFRADGSALQALPTGRGTVLLWDVAHRRQIRELQLPRTTNGNAKQPATPTSCEFSGDGRLIAASMALASGRGQLAVWETETGKVLWDKAIAATCLCFSADDQYVAAGQENGRATAWTTAGGREICTVSAGRLQVTCVTFARQPRCPLDDHAGNGGKWLLCTGDEGGTVGFWQFPSGVHVSSWHGSRFGVFGMTASPDGSLLAVGGHSRSYVLDTATAGRLLTVPAAYGMNGVNFSLDGHELAVYADPAGGPPQLRVLALEHGRGLLKLRGLTAQVRKLWLSRNGRLLAGLSDRWELGVWELPAGRLLHLFEAPVGYSSDNAGCAFDASNQRLAFAAGTRAVLWDIGTGRVQQPWQLPPGFQDLLAFHRSGKLLSFRVETDDGHEPPLSNSTRPRVCRIRDLLSANPLRPLSEKTDFNLHVYHSLVSPDGNTYLVQGRSGARGGAWAKATRVWDSLSGKLLRCLPWDDPADLMHGGDAGQDPLGQIVYVCTGDSAGRVLLELRTAKLVGTLGEGVSNVDLSPHAAYLAGVGVGRFSLRRRADKRPVFAVRTGSDATSADCPFNLAGTHVAWGNADGSVIVCDIPEVQKRLGSAGLEW